MFISWNSVNFFHYFVLLFLCFKSH